VSLTVYRYDGSFEGLLSAFAAALLEQAAAPEFCPPEGDRAGLLFGAREVPTRQGAATELLCHLQTAGGEAAPRTLAMAYLAELPDHELAMYEYCQLTLDRHECIDGWAAHPAVARVGDDARRVSRELHRFKGLLRFMETTDGVYYAPYEPDHNITVPLARYFAERLGGQPWIIHDRRRGLAVLWDGHSLQPGKVPTPAASGMASEPALSAGEETVQSQWRTYHRQIAIASRANPRLQRQCMPRRYWRYLVEMQG